MEQILAQMPEIIEIPGWAIRLGLTSVAAVVGVVSVIYIGSEVIGKITLAAKINEIRQEQKEEEKAAKLAEKISTHLPGPWAKLHKTMKDSRFWETKCSAAEAFANSVREKYPNKGWVSKIPFLTPAGLDLIVAPLNKKENSVDSIARILRVTKALRPFMVPYEGWTTNESGTKPECPEGVTCLRDCKQRRSCPY